LEFIICSSDIFTKTQSGKTLLTLSSLPPLSKSFKPWTTCSSIYNSKFMTPKKVLLLCGDSMEDYEVCFPKGPSLNSPNSFFCCRTLQAFGVSIDAVCPGKKSGDIWWWPGLCLTCFIMQLSVFTVKSMFMYKFIFRWISKH